MKVLVLTFSLFFALISSTFAYDRQNVRQDQITEGERINRILDEEADRARQNGDYKEARRLDEKGDKIQKMLDRKNNREKDRNHKRNTKKNEEEFRFNGMADQGYGDPTFEKYSN